MKISEILKAAAIIVVILLVFGFAAFGLNFYTQPLIEANNAGAANAILVEVLPNGKTFETLDPATLNLPENVLSVNKETNGAGYVFEVSVKGYAQGLVIRVGVDADGKIAGSTVVSSNETWGQETSLNGKYNGMDADSLELIIAAGATPGSDTSEGYYAAIELALQAFVLSSGGKLDPTVVLGGMVASLHTGLVNNGTLVYDEVAASGNIVKGWTSKNNTGAAYIMTKADAYYLVVVNGVGYAQVYNEEKVDVTADNSDLVAEAVAATKANTLSAAVKNKIKSLFGEAARDSAKLVAHTTFNTVSTVVEFTHEGNTLYLVQSKPYTYGNNAMTVYTVVDANGKIVKQETSTLIYDHYSVDGYNSNKDAGFIAWLEKYTGKTEDTLGDDLLIAGVTLSSTAVKNATADAFAALNSIK